MFELSLSQACRGCLLYKTASGKSPNTIRNYRNSYKKLQLYLSDDPPFASITRSQLIAFFVWLQEDYVSEPDGVAPRGKIKLSPKSIYNIHTAVSSLWSWGVDEGYVKSNIVRTIDAPKYEKPAIEPFTEEQARALLVACKHSRTWRTRATTNSRPTAVRDQAIILLLLDTGVRRSELCDICIKDIDLKGRTLHVRGKGKGRDKKERIVQLGKRTAKAIWRYMTMRLDDTDPGEPLFVVGDQDDSRPLKPRYLSRLVKRIGDRAGVSNVHPHRFRHTFAINYLRNDGDVFTLRILLGHSDLEMVERYLNIVRADCAKAHRKASPVDNWRL